MKWNVRRKLSAGGAGIILAFTGLTAIAGGGKLIANPLGSPEFPIEWLHGSCFTTYSIPGIVLLTVIGIGSLVALATLVMRYRHSGPVAGLAGLALMIYMTAEVWWVGLRNGLQPFYLGLGVLAVICGLTMKSTGMTQALTE